jgi:hypothetical protein
MLECPRAVQNPRSKQFRAVTISVQVSHNMAVIVLTVVKRKVVPVVS